MLKIRIHQSPCNGGPSMTPNQLRFRASSQKDQRPLTLKASPRTRMTSKIEHLQFAKLDLSTHVTNTKSMTPNQLRLKASGSKDFRHTPLGPCSGFKAKLHDFFSFPSFIFLFFFLFLFFSFLEDNIGLQLWVTQNYPRFPTYLRSALQSERRYANSQPIEVIWSAVCELA